MPVHWADPPLLTWAQASYLIVFSFRKVLTMNFAGMLECMMTEAAPILLAVEFDAMDARGRIILAAGEGVPRHDGPGHGQAWRRMVARRTPTRGKTALPSLSR